MPKVKTNKLKYPEGWAEIQPTLEEFDQKMKDEPVSNSENESHEGKRKVESTWPIFRIHHERSRYIYELYYKKKEISAELYEFLLDQEYGDRMLIAKWKKQGYERLCCLPCIQTRDTNFQTTCICRVPKSKLGTNKAIECPKCGCHGCSSAD